MRSIVNLYELWRELPLWKQRDEIRKSKSPGCASVSRSSGEYTRAELKELVADWENQLMRRWYAWSMLREAEEELKCPKEMDHVATQKQVQTLQTVQKNAKACEAQYIFSIVECPSNQVNTLEISGKNVDMSRIISMIEVLVTLVEAGQVGEDNKKAYCIKSFDERKVQAKASVRQIIGHEDAIEDHKDQLSNKDDRIGAMWKSISKIDESATKVSTTMQKRRELINLAVSRSNSVPSHVDTLGAAGEQSSNMQNSRVPNRRKYWRELANWEFRSRCQHRGGQPRY